ncbi:hypothetical protein M758_6G063600 [Ceratodon purpureus]|uniref:BHLH domain-containing protein n=1 Tax=Ceratodon purpureus TaxID=3225 RepID=A0A8T0HCZ1_CERPU|nr:hypothetical protein KC19_6G067700 [Ceratodon purpureus]KAG0612933.1 hypothetical protein M758_6G063600 [Ceratodon purpureus]
MAIMAPTPDQVFMGMNMQRSTASLPLSYPADSVSDLTNSLEVPSTHGRAGTGAGVPGFGRYWARSSWSSCVVDNSHLIAGGQQLAPPQTSTLGMPSFPSSPSALEFASFSAGKFNPGHGEMGPFSLGKSSLCEPASGGASSRTVQSLLEAVEGVTEASTMVEAAAATIAAATHGHVDVTQAAQQENTNNSSCSEHHSGGRGGGSSPGAHSPARSPSHDSHQAGARKRKKDLAPPDPKGGEGESLKPKRCKGDREEGSKARGAGERSSSEASTESGSPKAPHDSKGRVQSSSRPKEYSKQDYIHVRARRGQATDSHSLAERVRREKISERMKYLQDLVPGCKKVTGKAVMLDEIINYVQSLQRQVEHLSMKLASVNPAQQDLTLESLVSNKEMLQTHLSSILGSNSEAPGALDVVQMGLSHQAGRRLVGGGPCGFDFRSLGNGGFDHINSRHTMSPPIAGLSDHMTMVQRSFDNNVSQSTGWDGELQSVVQMGLNHQGRFGAFEGLHCQLPVHMKVEF